MINKEILRKGYYIIADPTTGRYYYDINGTTSFTPELELANQYPTLVDASKALEGAYQTVFDTGFVSSLFLQLKVLFIQERLYIEEFKPLKRSELKGDGYGNDKV